MIVGFNSHLLLFLLNFAHTYSQVVVKPLFFFFFVSYCVSFISVSHKFFFASNIQGYLCSLHIFRARSNTIFMAIASRQAVSHSACYFKEQHETKKKNEIVRKWCASVLVGTSHTRARAFFISFFLSFDWNRGIHTFITHTHAIALTHTHTLTFTYAECERTQSPYAARTRHMDIYTFKRTQDRYTRFICYCLFFYFSFVCVRSPIRACVRASGDIVFDRNLWKLEKKNRNKNNNKTHTHELGSDSSIK